MPHNHGTSKFRELLYIIFFGCCISLPMILHFLGVFDVGYITATERRKPAVLPELPTRISEFHAYKTELDDYLRDHFGFRSLLVTLNSLIRLKMGVSAAPEFVTVGKGGWFFYNRKDLIDQYRGIKQKNSTELDHLINLMNRRRLWLEKKGIPMIVVVAPEKHWIYPEFLPIWVTKFRKAPLEQFIDRTGEGTEFDIIDLRTPLINARKEGRSLYFKTDTHWNYIGGFIAYTEIMKGVKKYFPDLQTLRKEDIVFTRTVRKGMDLAASLNLSAYIQEENSFEFSFNFPSKVISYQMLKNNKIIDTNETVIEKKLRETSMVCSSLSKAPRALIIRDSYATYLSPFFNETFGCSYYAHHKTLRFFPELVELFKPDIVIYEFVERELTYDFPAEDDLAMRLYRQTISSDRYVPVMKADRVTLLPLKIRNSGSWTWPSTGKNFVRLSYRWFDPFQNKVIDQGIRTNLPRDVQVITF
jgi:hypothetical protein